MINIIFEFESQYGIFRDALNLPEDHKFSEEELTIIKQERFNNWLEHIQLMSYGEPSIEINFEPEMEE